MRAGSRNGDTHWTTSIDEMFRRSAQQFADQRCQWYQPEGNQPGQTASFQYKEVLLKVQELSAGLQALGLRRQDRVAMLATHNYKALWCDLAVMASGATSVFMHPFAKADEVRYILHHSAARMIFIEENKRAMLQNLLAELPLIKKIIVISASDLSLIKNKFITLDQLLTHGKHSRQKPISASSVKDTIKLHDPAAITYSVDNTGKLARKIYTHQNIIDAIHSEFSLLENNDLTIGQNDILLSFLPITSESEKIAQLLSLFSGGTIAYLDLSASYIRDFNIFQPTWFCAPPEYYEKIFLAMEKAYSGMPESKAMFEIAIAIGLEVLASRRDPASVKKLAELDTLPNELNEKLKWAEESIFSRFKLLFGNRWRFAICALPGLPSELANIYAAMGIKILPGTLS